MLNYRGFKPFEMQYSKKLSDLQKAWANTTKYKIKDKKKVMTSEDIEEQFFINYPSGYQYLIVASKCCTVKKSDRNNTNLKDQLKDNIVYQQLENINNSIKELKKQLNKNDSRNHLDP